jgi:hypothetical protein
VELVKGEVLRISLPGIRVNKGKKSGPVLKLALATAAVGAWRAMVTRRGNRKNLQNLGEGFGARSMGYI